MSDNPRGLIFNGALVPGVMSGTITVTSRVMKPQPSGCWSIPPARLVDGWFNRFGCSRDDESIRCPFRVGERRYVKEAWYRSDLSGPTCGLTLYKADTNFFSPPRWNSPMFMPRPYVRTWIEITAVRPARCQQITPDEAAASLGYDLPGREILSAYVELWNRLNAKRGFPWSANAWVWRCEFSLMREMPAVLAALKEK